MISAAVTDRLNSTDETLTLVGPLPPLSGSYHKWTAEECREWLLQHLEDAHINPSYLQEHEFFRTRLMTS